MTKQKLSYFYFVIAAGFLAAALIIVPMSGASAANLNADGLTQSHSRHNSTVAKDNAQTLRPILVDSGFSRSKYHKK